MNNEDKKVVAVYTRVSTLDQARERHSLEEQLARIKKVCEANDYTIYKVYTDAGISAKDTNRPAYQQMLRDMKLKKFNMIFAYKMDRLSRSIVDFEEFFNLTHKYNCGIELFQEKIDTNGATGMLFARILAIFAQFEREIIRERTLMGVESAVSKGHFGGKPPLGYKSEHITLEDGSKTKRWVINEEEAEIVKEIYALCISGKTYFQISTILKEKYQNIFACYRKDKKTGERYLIYRTWTDGSISVILNNKQYLGIYEFRKTVKNKETEEITGMIPQIISEDTYNKAQESIRKNARNYYRSKEYLFTQKLKCPKCGRTLACNGTRKPNKKEYLYYKCKDCNIYVREEMIEEAVISRLNDLLEIHLALDNNYYPIDTDLAESFNNCKLDHKIRFGIDKRVVEDKILCNEFEDLNKVWQLATYETKCKFISEYVDNIEIAKYTNVNTKITHIEVAFLKLRDKEINHLFELQKKGLIDNISGYGKYKSSVSRMNSKEEAEEYINILRKKFNFKVFEFNDKETGYWVEEAFKFIVVDSPKVIEKYRCYELVLCE